MTVNMIGMDPREVRSLSRLLTSSSERLRRTSTTITSTLGRTGWEGADGTRFRQSWDSELRPGLFAAAKNLADAAEALERNAQAQEETSANVMPSSGPGTGVGAGGRPWWEQASDGLSDVLDDALGWQEDFRADVWESVEATASFQNFRDAFGDGLEVARHGGDMAWDFLHGEPPSATELIALGVLAEGATVNLTSLMLSGGLLHPHLLDDGEATVGQPLRVGVEAPGSPALNVDGHQPSVVPSSLSDIVHNTALAYSDKGGTGSDDGAVRISRITRDGMDAYIVNIPGTQSWDPRSGGNPADLAGNLVTASGQSSTAADAVRLAMREAGIPAGAPVMLAGHSQGGMTAAGLAGNAEFTSAYNVTNVMAYGSPVDTSSIPSTIDVMAFQHEHDVVPKLDLGNLRINPVMPFPLGFSTPERPNSATVVTLDDPGSGGTFELRENHDYNYYADSIREAASRGVGPAYDYENLPSTQWFLTDDPSAVESYVIPIGRKQ